MAGYISKTAVAAVLVFTLLIGASVCAAQTDETLEYTKENLEELGFVPLEPETLQDKVNAAQLIVLGRVESVRQASSEPGKISRRSVRQDMIATVLIEEIFKGSVDSERIEVEFLQSLKQETPEPVKLSPGERCVMMLKSSPGTGRFRFITTYSGKESSSSGFVKELKETEGAMSDEEGSVDIVIELETESVTSGGEVPVKVTVDNSTGNEIILMTDLESALEFSLTGPDGRKSGTVSSMSYVSQSSLPKLALGSKYFYGTTIDLSDKMDFSVPGYYRLSARLVCPSSSLTREPATYVSESILIEVR
ncbi:MAG TPA: hypothetical protein PLN69_08565 [bacterium]|nr:hypothetical protein [bacterium]